MLREFKADWEPTNRQKGQLSFVRSSDSVSSLWQYLKRYENPTTTYSQLLERYPSMDDRFRRAKAQHIADAISQGHEFFRTAATSNLAIKPLILYYGALNLVKALMIHGDNPLTLQDAVQRKNGFTNHGFSTGTTTPYSQPGDQAIRDDNTNLLDEFCYALQDDRTVASKLHACWSKNKWHKGIRLQLGDLLSMHPHSWRSYAEFTGKPPKYYRLESSSFRTTTRGKEHVVYFSPTFDKTPYQKEVAAGAENQFKFFEELLPILASTYRRDEHLSYGFYSLKIPESIEDYLPGYRETTGQRYTMGTIEAGIPLHIIEVEFAILFILGNLARYSPHKWLKNTQYGGKGEMFVLEGFINSVGFSFPKLILEELEGRDYTFTGDLAYWG